MKQRFDVSKLIPEGYKAMYGVHTYLQGSGIDLGLLELVRLRVSQINGCAFCVAMHIPLGRKHGLGDHQINLVATWKEAPVFSERERAALAWAEALTVIVAQEVPAPLYARLQEHFSADEIAKLTLCIGEINTWNRLMLASSTPPALD
ncbi:MAG: alkylhydroperoxidase [Candidatus Dactylopiibacterium carminicum]|uniref:Alkylhydroperoxidase n=1 Tax=Candidatus Dactylopiibacterium carminicum TaxID=857335 RepID=A0A272EVW3_9RHOO|nr:carboxymuconolactone decarboxylase family protein [Candidatus Dactylopiibacterium carminicum]KAF7599601.1 carboxymuconolactone decarboxylase family protein [Candidatus Dactylopiibacterium carminicum]PAS94248.1 MAG: alkylhydroperoxidase [Candidatus Dactylopiibacterium carminicum]PAS98445.1 MAG: alkylhydroperoxidase [Candidatus Dactylopiibacterium carminicum]PAS99604.1 MAG: alkylhydroperoxidase [Candidatus Dactylopiibacterium carminicum]